ncbi:DUF1499 domain-containing protein [Celeribacter litoreus]|uniref:DUF1499 domain-containing protein n=1 Tax=Celeribacter litoreus TaxID=2876714 RepID=UPI001CD013B2|nr:DUF1499 domain-containing protein [Celeribacter litoreus]MCA0043694.1 DUF1499 domain-containing protein [Celeribacter litoreus]
MTLKIILFLLIAAVALLQLFVRLAPTVPTRWHVDPFAAAEPGTNGVKRVLSVPLEPDEVLTRLAAIAETEPRTRHVVGGVEDGRLTYRTRTAFWGFPDFTTIGARATEDGAEVVILARARFGQSDFGVNAGRADAWIAAAGL